MRRVLMLNYEYPPLGGGAGNATYYLIRELSKIRSCEIDLITSSTGKYREEKVTDNVTVYFLDIGKSRAWQDQSVRELLSYSWKTYWKARTLIRLRRPDLIHAFFGIPNGFIAGLLNRPYLVSLRGMDVPFYSRRFRWLDLIFFRWLSLAIWKKAKCVVANSNGLRELALKTYSKKRLLVIPNGIDTEQFQPSEKSHQPFTVLTVARLIPRKGLNYLIDGFAKFRDKYPASRLIVVGDGPMLSSLKEQTRALKLQSSIEFRGNVPHNELPMVYHEADVFVLPSLNEGMSNSLLEALASGLAIISTLTGGASELVSDRNGIIVERKNSKVITQALEHCQTDGVRLTAMKSASRQIAARFSWAEAANKYYHLYEKICAESTAS